MKAIILEDEQLAANRLIRMLREVAKDIKVAATFESIVDTMEYLQNNDDVDLLFLDIHVADGNSFDLFDLSKIEGKVIFTTAYDKYAIEAFRRNAIDYLLKPLKKEQLAEAIEKAVAINNNIQSTNSQGYKKRILVNFMSKIQSLKIDDIAYVYSKDKLSYFYMNNGDRYVSDYKLQELEQMLDPKVFFRANRQFIVHIDSLGQIRKHHAQRLKVSLIPDKDLEVVVSTDKTPFFIKWLEK